MVFLCNSLPSKRFSNVSNNDIAIQALSRVTVINTELTILNRSVFVPLQSVQRQN